MEAWLARGTAERRFLGALFLSFAVVGLLLAAGGLYGTLLFVAGERRREMGIRLALGASRGRIERRLLMSGLAVSGVGVAAGLAGSWYGGRFLERWVWGVEPADPATLLLASAVLLATAAVASWFPARNAARTDPVRTLREE
jgi:ABC-type antimicrobial peptide transport system permease subunit